MKNTDIYKNKNKSSSDCSHNVPVLMTEVFSSSCIHDGNAMPKNSEKPKMQIFLDEFKSTYCRFDTPIAAIMPDAVSEISMLRAIDGFALSVDRAALQVCYWSMGPQTSNRPIAQRDRSIAQINWSHVTSKSWQYLLLCDNDRERSGVQLAYMYTVFQKRKPPNFWQ